MITELNLFNGFVVSFQPQDFVTGQPGANQQQVHPQTTLLHDAPNTAASASYQDNTCLALCYGELLSYHTDADTETCLKHAVADWLDGKLKCERLNGRFVLLIWDKRSYEWNVITDRVGAMHAYWVGDRDTVKALGSDLRTLAMLASSRELDWEAIASFFYFGFFLEDRTYFTDVHIFLPCSIYRIDATGKILEHSRYWQWHHTIDHSRDYNQTIDEYHTLLTQAVRRCTEHGRPMLPISGGLDSRSLASVMERGGDTQAYSYGYSSDSIETRIASQIAQARGFKFTTHTIPQYLFDNLPDAVIALHGSQDITQARQVSIYPWLKENADAVLTGLWGDVWCDQMGLADGIPDGETIASHTAHKMQKRGRAWLIEKLVRPHLPSQPDIPAFLQGRIAAGLSKVGHIEDADFQVKAYKTSQWAFRWSNTSLRAFEMGATPRIPFYDVDFVDFFCTVPTAFVRERRLQIDHLKRYAPDLARIRWQEVHTNLYLAQYGYWLSLPERALKKAQRMLTNQRALQRNWEVQFLSLGGREGLNHWLLRNDLKLHNLIAPATISTFLDDFYRQPDAANGYTLSMLLTFSVWLQASL